MKFENVNEPNYFKFKKIEVPFIFMIMENSFSLFSSFADNYLPIFVSHFDISFEGYFQNVTILWHNFIKVSECSTMIQFQQSY